MKFKIEESKTMAKDIEDIEEIDPDLTRKSVFDRLTKYR